MAKHRAIAEVLSIALLGATSAMFACRGPAAAGEYRGLGDVDDGSVTDGPADPSDGAAAGDAPVPTDASAIPDDAAYSYPLSKCATGQDVFYLDVGGADGPLQAGEITRTQAATDWFVELQPELNIMLATADGPVGDIQVWTPDSSPVTPGTYVQGPSNKGPSIDVVVIEEGCHLVSGTFTLVDLTYDWPDGSVMGDVTSLLLSFNLVCQGNTIKGCVRYSR
jgi:hypothetical protein